MKKKIRLLASLLTLLAFVLVLTNSCKKDDNNNSPKSDTIFNPTLTYGTISDVEGNVYKTITIGSQTWMAENLKVSHYRNGDPIPNITQDTIWNNLTTGAWCDYDNKPINSFTYGKLYNWYAVNDNRNIYPEGWHIPTDTEWDTLHNFLAGNGLIGLVSSKMEETGTSHWTQPIMEATNESGFTALPGGYRNIDSSFINIYKVAIWWCANEYNYPLAWNCLIIYNSTGLGMHGASYKFDGYSVRCIKDN